MSSRPILLSGILILVAVAGIWVWHLSTHEPMSAFRDFPWTYVTEATAGHDPVIIIDRGTIDGPASVQTSDGATAWPAYAIPANLVPLRDGKPYVIPLIGEGPEAHTPRIPHLGRPLNGREMHLLDRVQTDEGRERLDAFRKGVEP